MKMISITNTEMLSTRLYLKEVRRFHVLTPEEECTLVAFALQGDEKARIMLVNSNLRWVITIAKKYQNCGIDFEDLIQLGNIGLIKAVDSFDPSRGVRLASFAKNYIKGSILNELKKMGKDSLRHSVWVSCPQDKKGDSFSEEIADDVRTDSTAISHSCIDHIMHALHDVTDTDRRLFLDYCLHSMDLDYIIDKWNVSEHYIRRVVKMCRSEVLRKISLSEVA